MSQSPCPGCGALVPDVDGPTHRYMESSPGCWAHYGEVLAREYSDFRYAKVHRLTVDAYAVQHPGRPSPQSIQSAALHLMSLCAVLERGLARERMPALLKEASRRKGRYEWLEPPSSTGEVTVADVHPAGTPEEHRRLVREWAESAWSAWSGHHPAVRTWLSELAGPVSDSG